ncbi:UPF0047 protein yjbQ [Thecamonas trahens ATCC 50062]|uniref:UPF0047 protein yjbQ n=1 Tax=Thecamonas trahens ATCC 50062 TaxID=461836 RepID=A0A0L0D197_THETB|nr:UPF0047 protein yjbQ [Thecamonas trahens ATCC 50062]KNC45905.1 UPF0047 protein yjbQ [Thecamonas trahens ATCC 50062]|eukprot:XP_013762893.1 UPF0047 protein yjbQ [Thecamonas trahens ATCC 50062]
MPVAESVSVTLAALPRGVHIITSVIEDALPSLPEVEVGTVSIFLPHTSASLLLNEACDPSVRVDLEMVLNELVPESEAYTHDDEGPDDMPAHAKSMLLGASVTLPVRSSRLLLAS